MQISEVFVKILEVLVKNLERWLEVEVENKAFSVIQEVQIVFLVLENRYQNALYLVTQTLFKTVFTCK